MNEIKTYKKRPLWQIMKEIDDVAWCDAEIDFSMIRINKVEKFVILVIVSRLNEFFIRRLDDGTVMKEVRYF